jgi:hypothetical protein
MRAKSTRIPRLWPPFVYLAVGQFLVSRPIEKRMADRAFGSGLILQGAGKDCTMMKLFDAAEGYRKSPQCRAVIFSSSHLWQQGGPTAGGKDWQGKGEGNQAFQKQRAGSDGRCR